VVKDQLTLVPSGFKQVSLQFWSDDTRKIELLRDEVLGALYRRKGTAFSWFCEGNEATWWMVEFWTTDQSAVLELCIEIAAEIGSELHI
jgi:hypothetical protein